MSAESPGRCGPVRSPVHVLPALETHEVRGAVLEALAPEAPGEEQMRADSAHLDAVAAGEAPASFRLYRWSRPCVTLGLGQAREMVDAGTLEAHGIDCVRRPTGGRALLHGWDLTYALVLPREHRLARLSIAQSYTEISRAVVAALAAVGLEAQLERDATHRQGPAGSSVSASGPRARGACFEEHLVETVLIGRRKVCGSAQARRRGAVLQHGSLPLTHDYDLQARLFYPQHDSERVASLLRRRMTGAAEELGIEHGAKAVDEVGRRLARALHATLGELVAGGEKGREDG